MWSNLQKLTLLLLVVILHSTTDNISNQWKKEEKDNGNGTGEELHEKEPSMMMEITFYTMNPKFLKKIGDPKSEYRYTKTIQTLEATNHDLAEHNKQLENMFWNQEEENSYLKKQLQFLTDEFLLKEQNKQQKQNQMSLDFDNEKKNLENEISILENKNKILMDEKRKYDAEHKQKIAETELYYQKKMKAMQDLDHEQNSKIQEKDNKIQEQKDKIQNLEIEKTKSEQAFSELKNPYETKILSMGSEPLEVQESNKIDNLNEEITVDQEKTKKKKKKKKNTKINLETDTKSNQIDAQIFQEKSHLCEMGNKDKIIENQNEIIADQKQKIQELTQLQDMQIATNNMNRETVLYQLGEIQLLNKINQEQDQKN